MATYRLEICIALAAVSSILSGTALAEVTYEQRDGVRYQVTRQVTQQQVPVTVMQDRQQTVYRPQVTTQSLNSQQLCCVPVTQYQWVSQLHGRWNPFVTPYWTHQLKPVTYWQQQVATVQVPVAQTTWVPETRTVQVPVTTYRMAEKETISRVAMNEPRSLASASPLPPSRPSATLAARPSYSSQVSSQNTGPIGGVARLEEGVAPQASGWRTNGESRY